MTTVHSGPARRSTAPRIGSGAPRIQVKGLAKRYGALEVFNNIDFEVGEREIVAVVGPSGCGKTTLLRCIDGLLPHDAGEIRVGQERVEEPIAGIVRQQSVDAAEKRVGRHVGHRRRRHGVPAFRAVPVEDSV